MSKSIILILITLLSVKAQSVDIFERTLTFPEGSRYEGMELDLAVNRNLQELTLSQIEYYFGLSAESGFYYVANFRHDGKYWVAKIPTNAVEKVIFQFQNLSTLAKKGIPKPVLEWLRMGHIQTRFVLKAGAFVELVTQDAALPRETARINDFSYALLAVRAKSQKGSTFDPVGDGMKGGYGISHNFISSEDTALHYRNQDLNVEQYELQLHKQHDQHLERASRILEFHIQKSISSLETDEYNTLKDSCVTNTMEGLYSAIENKPVIWWMRIWRNWRVLTQALGSGFEYNPRAVVSLLKKQGYIKQQLLNLEVEFKAWIDSVSQALNDDRNPLPTTDTSTTNCKAFFAAS